VNYKYFVVASHVVYFSAEKSTITLMKLIVGLGNIGKEYEKTRHNFGFLAIEQFAQKYEFSSWKEEKKFFGIISTGQIGKEKVILIKPNTFMNISGKAVNAVSHFYKITSENIWIWHDDVDLPFGKIRVKQNGGSGGHNGIKSIVNVLGSPDFPRLKFGIKNEFLEKMPTDKFVLGKFSTEEISQLKNITEQGILKFIDQIKC
jgi:peptidyl-tRNA hydrolase, PTH1 family